MSVISEEAWHRACSFTKLILGLNNDGCGQSHLGRTSRTRTIIAVVLNIIVHLDVVIFFVVVSKLFLVVTGIIHLCVQSQGCEGQGSTGHVTSSGLTPFQSCMAFPYLRTPTFARLSPMAATHVHSEALQDWMRTAPALLQLLLVLTEGRVGVGGGLW